MVDRLPQMQVSGCQLKPDKYVPPAYQSEGQTWFWIFAEKSKARGRLHGRQQKSPSAKGTEYGVCDLEISIGHKDSSL